MDTKVEQYWRYNLIVSTNILPGSLEDFREKRREVGQLVENIGGLAKQTQPVKGVTDAYSIKGTE